MKAIFARVNELQRVTDPVSRPYESKYKARELLQDAVRRLKPQPVDAARADFRLGVIAMDVEEQHEAETSLNAAAATFFPGLIEAVKAGAGDEHDPVAAAAQQAASEIVEALPREATGFVPAAAALAFPGEAMDLLNHLGILWSQRECPRRALFYLLASTQMYEA
ncbi:unnamed protein product, partial [Phaeothamnion confervicola]